MNDIIEKLRARTVPNWGHATGGTPHMYGHKPDPLCQEAVAEIERLREANEAFGKRQAWWTDRMFDLEQEVERLRAAAHKARAALSDLLASRDPVVYSGALAALDEVLGPNVE